MIILTFTLSGMLLLMLQLAIKDFWADYCRLSDQFEEDMGHDTKIFPDYEYE